jgi:hypothetical protein
MRLIAPFLPAKVHIRIATILLFIPILLFLPLKALQTRPSLDQRPVHREVFVTEQIPFRACFNTSWKNLFATFFLSKRSRFLENVLASHTGSHNQRNNRL